MDYLLIIKPHVKDLGDFKVRRVLPSIEYPMIGPWIFFDHMGPVDFKSGDGINVRPHPHINLATVTYLFEGEIWHRDSLGNSQAIHPGAINLMVAGKGIVHSERTREELKESGQRLHGLQLWLALPDETEEISPLFLHYKKDDIPTTISNGIPVRVLIGSAYGLQSPVKTFSETIYFEARLKKGEELTLPSSPQLGVYTALGSISCNNEPVDQQQLLVIEPCEHNKIKATSDCFIAVIGGAPLGKRHIFWNFVSSKKERIEQAKIMWKEMRFPSIPNDYQEFIPLP